MAPGRREDWEEREMGRKALSELISQGTVPRPTEHRGQARDNRNSKARDSHRIKEASCDRLDKREVCQERKENFSRRNTVVHILDLQPSQARARG